MQEILEKIVHRFVKEDILSNREKILEIEYKKEKKAFLEIKKIENIKNEIKELFDYFINIYLMRRENLKFGLKKVWLRKEEQNILEHHIFQINELLKKAENQNSKKNDKGYISMKKVFFWGYCDYRDLIREALKN